MKLITTLNVIREHSPCSSGWVSLLTYLDKSSADDEPLNIMEVLKSNDIEDAVWCLRCFDYRDYCLFLADVVELTLPIFEKQRLDDKRPALAIKAIRDWYEGKITDKQLEAAGAAAAAAAGAGARARARAAVCAAYAGAAYAGAAYAGAGAAARARARAAVCAAVHAAADAGKREQKWKEIEQLFIKHFGDNT